VSLFHMITMLGSTFPCKCDGLQEGDVLSYSFGSSDANLYGSGQTECKEQDSMIQEGGVRVYNSQTSISGTALSGT
jgi:hypothetical protein